MGFLTTLYDKVNACKFGENTGALSHIIGDKGSVGSARMRSSSW